MPTEQPQGCGGKPKALAIGIAPLGIVSMGIVPMGVVSIGVVPMGVLSIGAVGMGVINACVVGMGILVAGANGMGVWWVGMDGMGPKRLGGSSAIHSHHQHSLTKENLYAYPSKQVALEKAREMGCQGVHAMGSLDALRAPPRRIHKQSLKGGRGSTLGFDGSISSGVGKRGLQQRLVEGGKVQALRAALLGGDVATTAQKIGLGDIAQPLTLASRSAPVSIMWDWGDVQP